MGSWSMRAEDRVAGAGASIDQQCIDLTAF